MTRLGFRSLGLPLAITGTALVGLTPTTMSPFIVRTRTVTAAAPTGGLTLSLFGGLLPLLGLEALLTGASLSI
jgi:hypothetical protein